MMLAVSLASSLYAAAVTGTFLPPEMPESERMKTLAPFFKPQPGQPLAVDRDLLRDFPSDGNPMALRGFIEVRPPRGFCFTVQKDREQADIKVCKPTHISFRVADLTEDGRIQWQISTGAKDFGTVLTWTTPHRVAWVIKEETPLPGDPLSILMERCDVYTFGAHGRRLRVYPFDKKRWGAYWVINLPDKDKMIPQPEDAPNLFVTKEMRPTVIDTPEKKPGADGHEDPKKDQSGKIKDVPMENIVKKKEEYKLPWKITPKKTYTMNSSNFMPAGPVPPGMKGECRYRYAPSKEVSTGGLIECHGADQFSYVYLPLSCIGELTPR